MTYPLLGIDFGTQRIGVAIAESPLAEPLMIVKNSPDAIAEIVAICKNKQITQIIFGLSENQMAEKTVAFADQLKAAIDLPIEYIDETLSSKEMLQRRKVLKLSQRKGPIDHLVAAELLQTWMDEN